jgi:hypothetical protein
VLVSQARRTLQSVKVDAMAVVMAVVTLMGAGCETTAECPRDLEHLQDPALPARIGSGFVAGTAIVNRYVDSPDTQYRGYDLEITSRVAGLAQADQVMFAMAQTPIPGIEPGDEVLVVGRRGPRVAEIQSAGCPVLAPVGDP